MKAFKKKKAGQGFHDHLAGRTGGEIENYPHPEEGGNKFYDFLGKISGDKKRILPENKNGQEKKLVSGEVSCQEAEEEAKKEFFGVAEASEATVLEPRTFLALGEGEIFFKIVSWGPKKS